jgi:site-specific recombinase XerC
MLWVGRRGHAMDGEEIAQRIGVVTKRHLRRRMWPHLFRDCLATDVAIHDSEHVGIVKEVLGHASFATTEKYYIQASSFHVSKRMQDVVARLRVGD